MSLQVCHMFTFTCTGCPRISNTIWKSYKFRNMWPKLLNYDSNERRNSVFYPHKKFGGKTCLSLNYDATKLYISLVPLNFIQDESEKRTDIFRFKTVFSNTYNTYKVVRIIKYTCKNTMEKNNSKNQYIF